MIGHWAVKDFISTSAIFVSNIDDLFSEETYMSWLGKEPKELLDTGQFTLFCNNFN